MARILAIDWDQKAVHVVAAKTSRDGVSIERAAQWDEPFELTPDSAEEAARRLRERLKEFGIGAAPVIISLGRERVILKDIRYPQVPPSEEPALVRFQASKELTDNPDEVVIDYCTHAQRGPAGERQATAVIVRRDVLSAYRTLCSHAGLKLVGIAPRPFGVAGTVQRTAGSLLTPAPSAPDDAVAVLTLGERWAELCVVRDGSLLFARSLAMGPMLPNEVKRSLAVFAGSAHKVAPTALYVAVNGEHGPLRERLQDLLDLPVHPLDPFGREEHVEVKGETRGGFTGAVGLLHLWGKTRSLPINFVRLREAQRESDPATRRWVLAAGVAFFIVAGLFVFSQIVLAEQRAKVEQRRNARNQLDDTIKLFQQERDDFAAIKDWDQTTIPWLDELYELAARMDHAEGFKLTRLNMKEHNAAAMAAAKKGPKDNKDAASAPVGQMLIYGVMPQDKDIYVHNLMAKLARDKHLQPNLRSLRPAGSGREFSLDVDLRKQPIESYKEVLEVPPQQPRKKKGGRS